MASYEIIPGTEGLGVFDVVHLIVPGGGRDATGESLSRRSRARADCAADFWQQVGLSSRGGVVICTGYKTPTDRVGRPWTGPDGERFVGVPEGELLRRHLAARNLGGSVLTEIHSIDTATNLVRARGCLPDEQPVGIVSHPEHLRRILRDIAPRTLRNPFLGIAVPEAGQGQPDSILVSAVERYWILWGATPGRPNLTERTHRRAALAWWVAGLLAYRNSTYLAEE